MLNKDERLYFIAGGLTLFWEILGLAGSALFCGFGSGLFIMYLHTFIRKDTKTRVAWIMLVAASVTFSLAVLYVAVYYCLLRGAIYTGIVTVKVPFNANGMLESVELSQKTYRMISEWVFQLIFIVNDITILWRTWVISFGQRWLTICPFVTLLGTCAVSFVYLGLLFTNSESLVSNDPTGPLFWGPETSASISLATNVFSTAIICYKLWKYRSSLWNSRTEGHWTLGQRVLVMLIESGLVLFVLQLIILTANITEPPSTFRSYFFKVVYEAGFQIIAMYPTAVLTLIEKKKTLCELQMSIELRIDS